MRASKLVLIVAAAAAMLGVGCGDDDGRTTTDSGMETDSGMPTDGGTPVDSGPRDSGPRDSGTPRDAGDPMGALGRLLDANAMLGAEDCECTWMSAQYESVEQCVAATGMSTEARMCLVTAYEAMTAAVGFDIACNAGVFESYAACVADAMCNETDLMTCQTNAASAGCPDPSEAFGAIYAAAESCLTMNVVGPAGTCPDMPDTVSMMTGASVFTGTTVGQGDDLQAMCVMSTGAPDVALRWAAPADGTYVFDTLGSSFDTVLYVINSCDTAATPLGCNDDLAGMAGNYRSRTMATLMMGQEVIVVVDGYAGDSAGTFVVNINAMAMP